MARKKKKRPSGKPFVKGCKPGPGRPPGSKSRTTIDARLLRKRIVESWDAVDGDAILAKIARDKPIEYMKLVASLISRVCVDEETKSLPDIKIVITNSAPPMKPKPELLPAPVKVRALPVPVNGEGKRAMPALPPPPPEPPEPPVWPEDVATDRSGRTDRDTLRDYM